jgi:glycosyltransferase involved in cell wall biosynthesis
MGYSSTVSEHRTSGASGLVVSARLGEQVRAAEDRQRVERAGARLSTETELQRLLRKLGDAARRAAPRDRRRARLPNAGSTASADRTTRDIGERMRIALSIAAPSARIAARWGDWHLAAALARSLERAGHVAGVRTADRLDGSDVQSFDVEVVLRGLRPQVRRGAAARVLWVISHPDDLTVAECDEADLILVASSRFAEELRSRTATPVEVLLQATDHHRFRQLPPDPELHHDVVAVAKTRDVPRPVVMDAIAAGLRPAIFGSGWEAFVDPSLVVASYVPNNELPRLYASAGVVLNDHWASMRDAGFVSNRLFDVLACATPVISDDLPEIADLFDGAVLTYRSVDELATHVDDCLRDPEAARQRAEHGRHLVLAAHTFDHRVVELEHHLRRHLLPG